MYLYCNGKPKLPNLVDISVVSSLEHAVRFASSNEIDYLVFKPEDMTNLTKVIINSKQKCITWAHNFYDYKTTQIISENQYIIRNVFVGKKSVYEIY